MWVSKLRSRPHWDTIFGRTFLTFDNLLNNFNQPIRLPQPKHEMSCLITCIITLMPSRNAAHYKLMHHTVFEWSQFVQSIQINEHCSTNDCVFSIIRCTLRKWLMGKVNHNKLGFSFFFLNHAIISKIY